MLELACERAKRDGGGGYPDPGNDTMEPLHLPVAQEWVAAWTKSRAEKALRKYLETRGVPVFLPLVVSRRSYGRLVRQSQLPLFSGYVFYDAASISRSEVFASRYVADVLVPNDTKQLRCELESLAVALASDASMRECRLGGIGSLIEVVRGPLKGVRGELVRFQTGHRLVLHISFLGKSAELAIDEAFVTRQL